MRLFRPHLASLGLTEQQWRVLRVLGEDGASEAGHVAARACILPPSLSRIIRALEEQKYITSFRDKSDGRRTMIQLAAAGERLLAGAAQHSAEIYATIERAFGKNALADLLDRLEQLQAALEDL
jgi:homoprotocatechuate degradation regulator HpaR